MQYFHCIILLILGLSIIGISLTEACTCLPPRPQEQICEASFVAVFRLKGFNVHADDKDAKYDINVLELFKATPEAKLILKNDTSIWTKYRGAMASCGRPGLSNGSEWLTSGRMANGKLYIGSCSLLEDWSDMTKDKREIWRRFLTNLKCPTKIREFPA